MRDSNAPPSRYWTWRARFRQLNIGVNEYSYHEAKQLATTVRFCFASLPSAEQYPSNQVIRTLYQPLTYSSLLLKKQPYYLHSLEYLRSNKAFANFTIYPTTESSLDVNDLLWHVVRNGIYDPTQGDPLLGAHVFMLGIAPELYKLLASTSLQDIHRGIIDFLVLLHHQLTSDGDDEGLVRLSDDILPRIWDEVIPNIGIFPNGEPTDPHRAKVLEQLVQISFMTPWRVDVFAAFLTADDVTEILELCPNFCASAMDYARRAHFQMRDKRNSAARRQGEVMLKLYQDWRVFSAVLHDGMGLPYKQVTEAMERAVHRGKSVGIFEQAFVVLEAFRDGNSHLSMLPSDVLERTVVPWIVRRGCEAIAPRRRKLASLQSLLEVSSRYLDDLHAVGDLAGALEVETSVIVAPSIDDHVGDPDESRSVEVTTSDRVELGVHNVHNDRSLVSMDLGQPEQVLASLDLHEIAQHNIIALEMDEVKRVAKSSEVPSRFSIDTSEGYPLNNTLWDDGSLEA